MNEPTTIREILLYAGFDYDDQGVEPAADQALGRIRVLLDQALTAVAAAAHADWERQQAGADELEHQQRRTAEAMQMRRHAADTLEGAKTAIRRIRTTLDAA